MSFNNATLLIFVINVTSQARDKRGKLKQAGLLTMTEEQGEQKAGESMAV